MAIPRELTDISYWHPCVHPYSTDVFSIDSFKKYKKTLVDEQRYYGIELEHIINASTRGTFYEISNNMLKHFEGKNTLVCLKEDGSVYNRNFIGLELVTAPMLWNQLFNDFKSYFETFENKLITADNCGMHVHVTRNSFTQVQIQLLNVFINAKENREFLHSIAGRNGNTFCTFKNKHLRDLCDDDNDRYKSLNIRNDCTIEFRFFKSPVTYSDFFKKLFLTATLCEFICACNISQLNHEEYCSHIQMGSRLVRKLKYHVDLKDETNKAIKEITEVSNKLLCV